MGITIHTESSGLSIRALFKTGISRTAYPKEAEDKIKELLKSRK